jgi:hypothetical protein
MVTGALYWTTCYHTRQNRRFATRASSSRQQRRTDQAATRYSETMRRFVSDAGFVRRVARRGSGSSLHRQRDRRNGSSRQSAAGHSDCLARRRIGTGKMIQISTAFVVSSVLALAACGGSEQQANSAVDASGPAITTEEKGGPGTLSPATESTSPGGPSTGTDTTGTGTSSPGNTGTAGSTGTTGTAGSAGTTSSMGTGTSTGATSVTGP